jgi:hypothetical protein
MKEYEKALASQKWGEVEPLKHNDVCVIFSSGTYRGKVEVQKAFENAFNTIKDEDYSISNIYWVLIGIESAICISNFHWTGLINGQPSSGGGRGTSVLV